MINEDMKIIIMVIITISLNYNFSSYMLNRIL